MHATSLPPPSLTTTCKHLHGREPFKGAWSAQVIPIATVPLSQRTAWKTRDHKLHKKQGHGQLPIRRPSAWQTACSTEEHASPVQHASV